MNKKTFHQEAAKTFLCLASLVLLVLILPLTVQAQHVGTPLVSTSTGGVVSGTYGYFQYISASSNNLTTTDSTKVAKVGDTMTGNLHVAPSGVGSVTVNQGNVTNPGYVEFRTSDTTRRGYIGWGNGSNLTLTTENSWGQSFITGGAERMRITAAGLLGIGTGSPSYKFDAHDTVTDTSGGRFYNGRFYKYFNPASASSAAQANLWVQCDTGGGANNLTGDHMCQQTTNNYQGTATLTALYGGYTTLSNNSTGTITTAYAQTDIVNNSAGGTITTARGSLAQVNNAAGGTIGSAAGLQSQIVNGGAGTITNAFGLVTSWVRSAGTITNGYGIYLNDVDASTGWGIYQLGSNDGNYFAGKVGVGTVPTGYQFSVGGDIYSSSGWVRTTGTGGWYSETYGGGWHMTDTTWLRAYNSKSVYTPGTVQADTQINTAQICNTSGASCVAQSALGGSGSTDVQTFTSSGTWNKPSSGNMVYVQCWGGGGGGARNTMDGAGSAGAGGGGGGGYMEAFFAKSSLGATESVTIGAGGTGRTASTGVGTAGGNTTFGSWLTAYGGGGGPASSSGGTGGLGVSSGATGGYNNYFSDGYSSSGGPVAPGSPIKGGGGGGMASSNATHRTGSTPIIAGHGGAGGNGSSSSGGASTAGTQPGGGGGSGWNANGSNGAAGMCRVTTF